MLQKDQPLWLPPGSVQAIGFLIIAVTFAYLAVTSQVKLTAENVVTIVVMVFGFYFVVKAAAQGAVTSLDQSRIIAAAIAKPAPVEPVPPVDPAG